MKWIYQYRIVLNSELGIYFLTATFANNSQKSAVNNKNLPILSNSAIGDYQGPGIYTRPAVIQDNTVQVQFQLKYFILAFSIIHNFLV